jgi:hypothetical protein
VRQRRRWPLYAALAAGAVVLGGGAIAYLGRGATDQVNDARAAAEKRGQEDARRAEEARLVEERRKAEVERLGEERRRLEADRLATEQRKAELEAEERRRADRLAAEERRREELKAAEAKRSQEQKEQKPAQEPQEQKPPIRRAAFEHRDKLYAFSLPGADTGKGIVTINADPFGDVTVNDVHYGRTPREILVPAGRYEVRVTHARFGEQRKHVDVRAGARETVMVIFASE